jgi:hypothetical protein
VQRRGRGARVAWIYRPRSEASRRIKAPCDPRRSPPVELRRSPFPTRRKCIRLHRRSGGPCGVVTLELSLRRGLSNTFALCLLAFPHRATPNFSPSPTFSCPGGFYLATRWAAMLRPPSNNQFHFFSFFYCVFFIDCLFFPRLLIFKPNCSGSESQATHAAFVYL